jgi:hypothetical protein
VGIDAAGETPARLQVSAQTAALVGALLTLVGGVIGHYVSLLNTQTTAHRDVDIKKLEVDNSHALEKAKHSHQVALEDQKFVRDIIAKTLEKGSADEQIRNLKAYAKISLIGSPYKEALLSLPDNELPTVSDPNVSRAVGKAADSVNVRIFNRVLTLAKSVGLVKFKHGNASAMGTGFLVSERLLITVWHVLPDKEAARSGVAIFGFDEPGPDAAKRAREFELDADVLFLTNKDVGYSLVAVKPNSKDGTALSGFGSIKLTKYPTIIQGQPTSLIHHPRGKPKEIIFVGGVVFDISEKYVQYGIFTEPGSAGGPVLNSDVDVLAIHSAFVPAREASGKFIFDSNASGDVQRDVIRKVAKEGFRIDKILDDIALQLVNASSHQKTLAGNLLSAAAERPRE